jgi:hypothetical protein
MSEVLAQGVGAAQHGPHCQRGRGMHSSDIVTFTTRAAVTAAELAGENVATASSRSTCAPEGAAEHRAARVKVRAQRNGSTPEGRAPLYWPAVNSA